MTQRTRRGRRTIKACTKDRIPMSLSNYIYGPHDQATAKFKALIIGQPMNPERICKALNECPSRLRTFSPYQQTENQITLKATDYMGNVNYIYITEEH